MEESPFEIDGREGPLPFPWKKDLTSNPFFELPFVVGVEDASGTVPNDFTTLDLIVCAGVAGAGA